MSEFLQECYVAAGHADAASRALVRMKAVAVESTEDGHRAHLVRSILVPRDETWFLLWEADSADTVRDVARRAGVACDRITEALDLPPLLQGSA